MVGNGQMLVIRLERIVWATEEDTNVVGVVQTSVEIGVIANLHRDMVGDLGQREQGCFLEGCIVFKSLWELCVGAEDVLQILAHLSVHRATKCCEVIQCRLAENG